MRCDGVKICYSRHLEDTQDTQVTQAPSHQACDNVSCTVLVCDELTYTPASVLLLCDEPLLFKKTHVCVPFSGHLLPPIFLNSVQVSLLNLKAITFLQAAQV